MSGSGWAAREGESTRFQARAVGEGQEYYAREEPGEDTET